MRREYWETAKEAAEDMKDRLAAGDSCSGNDPNYPRYRNYVACYAIVGDEGDWVVHSNQACHAGLQSPYPVERPVCIVNSIQSIDPLISEEQAAYYYDYLANRSPYQSAFLKKNADEVFEDMVSYHPTDIPANILMGGLIALRRIWETSHILYIWNMLANEGMDEDYAYLVAHNGWTDGETIYWSKSEGGHSSIDLDCMGLEGVDNFVRHAPVELNPNYDTFLDYEYIDRTWGDYDGDSMFNILAEGYTPTLKDELKNCPFPIGDASSFDKENLEDGIKNMYNHAMKIAEENDICL